MQKYSASINFTKWRYAIYVSCVKPIKSGIFFAIAISFGMFIASQYKWDLLLKWCKNLFIANIIIIFMLSVLNFIPQMHRILIKNNLNIKEENRISKAKYDIICKLLTIFCVVFSSMMILQNFGIGLDFILALSGISGVALGWASRDFLSSLLATAVIYWDKPFVVGDTIKINGIEGVVEKIDWRFTILRPIHKKALFIPNSSFITGNMENLSLCEPYSVGFIVILTAFYRAIEHDMISDLQQSFGEKNWSNKVNPVDIDLIESDENNFSFKIYINANESILSEQYKEKILFKIDALNQIQNIITKYSSRFNIKIINS